MGEITRSYITMFVTDAQKTAITDMFRENKWLCLLHVLSDANVAEVFAKGLGKIFPSDDSVFDDPSMSDFIADFKIEVNDIASDSDVEENADFHESDTESSSETTRENKDELTLSSDRHMFKIQAPDSIEIQAPNIKIEPPDSIEIEAPSNIKMEAPDSIEIEAPNSMEMKVDSQSRGSHIDHDDAISKRTNPVSFQNNSNLNSNNQVLSYSQIQQQQLDTSINGQNLRASSVNEVNKATSPGIQGIPLLFSVNGKPYIATVNGKLAVFSTGIKPSVPDVHGQQNNSGGPVSVVKRQDNAMISLLNVTSQQNISQKHVPVVEKQQDNTMIPLFNVTSHQNNFQKHVPVVEKQQDNTMIPLFNVTSQQNNFQKNQGNVSIPVSTVIAQQFPTSVSLPDAKAQQNNSGVPVSGANEQKNNTWIFPVCAPKSQQSNGVANVKTQQNGLQIVMAHQNKKYYVESHQNSSNTHVQNVKKPPINAGTPMNNVMAVQNKADIPVKNVKGQHTNGNIPLQIGNSIPLLEDLLEQKGIAWKDKRKKAKQTSKSAQSLTTFKLHNTDTELPSQNVMRTCKGIYVCNTNAPKTDTEKPVPNIKEQHIDAELSLQTVKGQPTTTGLPISNEDAQQINAGIPVPEVKLEQTEAGIPLGNINRQQTDSSVLVPDEREQQNNASKIQVLEMKRQHTGQLNLKDDGISASIVEGQQIHEGGNGAVKKGADRPLILQRANRHYIRKRANRPIILEESCVETSLTPGMSHHTVRQTETSIRLFHQWLAKPPRNETRSICHMMPAELDKYIGCFLRSVQKADGYDYEPDTLTSYHRGIDRYLRANKYSFNIVTDIEFATSRAMLASKRKELRAKGKGKRPNAAGPLGPCEEAILREKGILGTDNPEQLLNTVWLNNTVLFGLHGGSENRNLMWGDIQLKVTDSGQEYIEYNERLTKTRTAEKKTETREINPKQFARENKDFCPVHAYKEYARHRPPHTFHPKSPFYLSINHSRRPWSITWFKSQAMGENYLRTLMKKMAQKGGLQGRKTNQSVRKTNCAELLQGDVAPTTIQQVTSHNVCSINNDAIASLQIQEQMSDVLSDKPDCETLPDIKPTLNQAVQIPSDSNTLPSTSIANHSSSFNNCTSTIIDHEKSSDPKKRRIEP